MGYLIFEFDPGSFWMLAIDLKHASPLFDTGHFGKNYRNYTTTIVGISIEIRFMV